MEEKKLTGYPSIDKPWLKYYSEEAIHAPLPECTAYERIRRGNNGHPDDIALIYFDRKITYRQLFDGIERAAKAFAALGIAQGDIVILCVVNMPEAVYALYALDRLGAVANLIDPRTNAEQLRNYINECDAKLVVTVDLAYSIIQQASNETTVERIITISPADSLPPVKRIAYLLKNKAPVLASGDMCWADFIARGGAVSPEYAPYEKNRCFVIAHTGGTTGIPKGVMLSDDNINAVAHGYQYLDIPFERQHKYFDDLPPFIIYWLMPKTAYYHNIFLRIIKCYIERKMEQGNYCAAHRAVVDAMSLDPYDSELNTDMILIMYHRGGAELAKSFLQTAESYMSEAQIAFVQQLWGRK